MNRLNLSAALLATVLAGTASADKIAIVDMQKAVAESNAGKAAISTLAADTDKGQKELKARSEELKKIDADLAKQASTLKPEVLAQKKRELDQKVMQLQETYNRMQKELAEKEQ